VRHGDLVAFADVLRRHLATVIGAERGYVGKPCPTCSGAGRGVKTRKSADFVERAQLVHRGGSRSRATLAACPTCHGGQRVWARRTTRGRPLSDRELIELAARESEQTGQLAGGERPSG
jgi:hypothetical protein